MNRKILIVITTAFVPTGGLATVMMNYYRKIDKGGLQIDFASTNEAPAVLTDELAKQKSHYYCLGKRSHILLYFTRLYKLCKEYDVIHINGNSATTTIELISAYLAGVKTRINHNHTAKTEHKIIHNIMQPIFKRLYTQGLACSENAGTWLFGKEKFLVLKNAIDTEKYRYSQYLREKYRKELNISEKTMVVGHVGKIYGPKNHKKLVSIFYEYQKTHEFSKLLIVGDGVLRTEIEKQVNELDISDKVIITGIRTDTPGFLSAMDVFIFPSVYEGLGLAVIEAQASGLACLLSDKVPQDVYMSSHMKGLSLDVSSAEWATMIDVLKVVDREKQSTENIRKITQAGYNISTEANKLSDFYRK